MGDRTTGPDYAWEEALARHYLRTDGPFGASTLRFMDTSPQELAEAVGLAPAQAQSAKSGFLASFDEVCTREVLGGRATSFHRTRSAPGFFRYLILSYIAAASDEDVSDGQFRERLRVLLGLDTAITQLQGLPALWKRLERWCATQHADGRPYRRVSLPERGHMRQIGQSVGIAFPCHRDRLRFERLLREMGTERSEVGAIVEWTRAHLPNQPWSRGFEAAFGDFEVRYRSGERLLADHPFWLFFIRSQAGDARPAEVWRGSGLELAYDVDDRILLRLTTRRAIRGLALRDEGDQGFSTTCAPGDLDSATRGLGAEMPDLVQAFRSGVLPFVETSWGRWGFDPRPTCPSLRMLVHARLMPKANRSGRWVEVDDDWRLSDTATLDAWRALTPTASIPGGSPTSIAFNGGVRSGKEYLGRPRLLPSVAVPPGTRLRLDPTRVERGSAFVEYRSTDSPAISSVEPLRGVWRISASEHGGLGTENEVRISFVDDAYEHDETTFAHPKEGWREEVELTVREGSFATRNLNRADRRRGVTAIEGRDDLLEAVYAGGRHGWAEADLVPLLGLFTSTEDVSPWDVVRSLCDGGWVEPFRSTGWGVRRWRLRPPTLVVRAEGEVLTDGAWCATAMARLRRVCDHLGAEVMTMAGPSKFSVPVTVVRGVDPHRIADATKLRLGTPTMQGIDAAPSCWPTIEEQPVNRTLTAKWCWKRRHFVAHGGQDGVRLERWARANGDLHDLYLVRVFGGPGRSFATRGAAIIEAHRLAREPLFTWHDGFLMRTACDGYLPSNLARALRIKHSASPGPAAADEWRRSYVYPCDRDDLADLACFFGAAIRVPEAPDRGATVALSRRLGARGRALLNPRLVRTSH